MEKGQFLVTQEGDNEVVVQSKQVERIREEQRKPKT